MAGKEVHKVRMLRNHAARQVELLKLTQMMTMIFGGFCM
jgi:hypothetical protein